MMNTCPALVRRLLRLAAATILATAIWPSLAYPAQEAPADSSVVIAQAKQILHEALLKNKEWVKVHAAEMLLANNLFDDVRETFEAELANDPPPPYRIGVYRVLARAYANNQARQKMFLNKIVAAFEDVKGPDRLHAAETLAKLGYSEKTPAMLRAAKEDNGALGPYARWVLANSRTPEDEAYFTALLDSEDPDIRVTVGYGYRFFEGIQDASFQSMVKAISKEPADSPARVYLLSAVYVHANSPGRDRVAKETKAELLKLAREGQNSEKNEACLALAERGDASDWPLLRVLLSDPDTDVRLHAANALLRIERREVHGL